MEWPQALTILVGNIGLFLWATRQARSDYLHMDKKFDEHRKETQKIVNDIKESMNAIREENRQFYAKLDGAK